MNLCRRIWGAGPNRGSVRGHSPLDYRLKRDAALFRNAAKPPFESPLASRGSVTTDGLVGIRYVEAITLANMLFVYCCVA